MADAHMEATSRYPPCKKKEKGHKGYPIAAFAIFISPPRARTRAYPSDYISAKGAGRTIKNPC